MLKISDLGRKKEVIIDEFKNNNLSNTVKLITDKSKCDELF